MLVPWSWCAIERGLLATAGTADADAGRLGGLTWELGSTDGGGGGADAATAAAGAASCAVWLLLPPLPAPLLARAARRCLLELCGWGEGNCRPRGK